MPKNKAKRPKSKERKEYLHYDKRSSEHHTIPSRKGSVHPALSFEQVLRRWLDANSIRLKGATVAKYGYIIDTHIVPGLGKIAAEKIDSGQVNSFLTQKLNAGGIRNGEALSASYVKTMAVIIEAAIKYGTAEGLCSPLRTPVHKPVLPKHDLTVLTDEQQRSLIRKALFEPSGTSVGVVLALQAGLRIGEVCGLRWCDTDLDRGILHIRHTVARVINENKKGIRFVLDTPKTIASKRDIPITQTLIRMLVKRKAESRSEFVVSDTVGFTNTRTFDHHFRKWLNENGFSVFNFHALRHTFATHCAEHGMDAKTLSDLLGHASVSITFNIYVHPPLSKVKKQLDHFYSDF